MLGVQQYVNKVPLFKFICSTYDPIIGGFMKSPDAEHVGKEIDRILLNKMNKKINVFKNIL